MITNVLILGGIIVDKYYVIDRYPEQGTDAVIREQFDVPGGCALNVAMTLINLDCTPYIYSKLGNDSNGTMIEAYLRDCNLERKLIERVKKPTEYCLVMVDDTGERTFMTSINKERQMSELYANKARELVFDSAYVTGYFMSGVELESPMMKLLEDLSADGTKILFDPGAAVDQLSLGVLKRILSIADVVTPNKYEASVINNILDTDLKDIMQEDCWLVQKDGGSKLTVSVAGRQITGTPFKVQVIDTTGAGDSFAGGLLYGIGKGLSIEETLEVAMACGAITTTFREPHGRFSLMDVNQIISNGRKNNEK